MSIPKVSVIIPTYKRSDRIERALKSVINQDYGNFEVIVVDDNNPDTEERRLTESIMKKYQENKIVQYVKHEKNKNGSAARNTGISYSTGEFITFLDDDDEYYPNKVREQVNQMSKLDHSWGLNYSNYDKINKFGKQVTSAEKAEGNILVQVISKNLFIGSGSNFMVRKSIVDELDGFDETFERNQDLEFLVRVAKKYKIKHLDKSLFLIHNEVDDKNFTFEEILNVHNRYRDRFSLIIESLDINSKIEVLKLLDLWDIRLAITHKKYRMGYNIYKNSRLNKREFFEYIKYLLDRHKHKTSYGFMFNIN